MAAAAGRDADAGDAVPAPVLAGAAALEVTAAEPGLAAGRSEGAAAAADGLADCAGAGPGFKRSPTEAWREAELGAGFAATRDAAFGVGFDDEAPELRL
jgi:hypothetical protein